MDPIRRPQATSTVEKLSDYFERVNFGAYVLLLQKPWRLFYLNFIGGLARGIGIGLGFTLIAALLIVIMQRLAVLNIPLIGSYIADVVRIVQAQLRVPTI
ncbi:MAG: DUF5665 domain-containing protein [Acidibacillus sp.]|uniref:Uncharacterized protein n=1 Tax=Sulfoacidibacillus ferrooxidans TaxID=2005001 RepID=A0A9X2AE54_9BACL|nr:DUF5665 domain-containing protein [Sulfoacidibacillus ferrooxidans]MCI0184195.1 hypothetical protein [Sulfoacidibacillus ferrooxidans]MCY0892950.1 DUF5665 domain-containing protein [Acidibacillus sp.]